MNIIHFCLEHQVIAEKLTTMICMEVFARV